MRGRIYLGVALLLLGCATTDFHAAEEMVRQQKFYNAIELYLSFVKSQPGHRRAPEALFEVGRIEQVILNEPEKAAGTFRTLVSHYPINAYTLKAQRHLAEIQKNHFGNCSEAIVEYEKLLRAAPDGPDTPKDQFEIARCYTQLRKYDQAAVEYRALIRNYPKYTRMDEVYFQMGNNAYIQGQYGEALEAYRKVAADFPKSPLAVQARFGIGNSYEETEDYENARRQYEAILKEYPSPKVITIRLEGLKKREAKKTTLAPGSRIRSTMLPTDKSP